MTLDVRSSVSLEETYVEATPSQPLVFHVSVENMSRGPRSYAAHAIGLKNARVSAEPRVLHVPAEGSGEIVVKVEPRTDKSSFPAGKFLIGIEVHDLTPSDPSLTMLSAEVEVLSVADLVATLTKPHLTTWLRSRTTLQLRNDGDHHLELELYGRDPEDHLDFTFSRKGTALGGASVTVPPDSTRAASVKVTSPRPKISFSQRTATAIGSVMHPHCARVKEVAPRKLMEM